MDVILVIKSDVQRHLCKEENQQLHGFPGPGVLLGSQHIVSDWIFTATLEVAITMSQFLIFLSPSQPIRMLTGRNDAVPEKGFLTSVLSALSCWRLGDPEVLEISAI